MSSSCSILFFLGLVFASFVIVFALAIRLCFVRFNGVPIFALAFLGLFLLFVIPSLLIVRLVVLALIWFIAL